jgi:hypothetical protein
MEKRSKERKGGKIQGKLKYKKSMKESHGLLVKRKR